MTRTRVFVQLSDFIKYELSGCLTLSSFDSKGNYSATSNTKLVHWPLMLHLVQRGGAGRAVDPPSPLLAVPNVTALSPPINGQCTSHCIGV